MIGLLAFLYTNIDVWNNKEPQLILEFPWFSERLQVALEAWAFDLSPVVYV